MPPKKTATPAAKNTPAKKTDPEPPTGAGPGSSKDKEAEDEEELSFFAKTGASAVQKVEGAQTALEEQEEAMHATVGGYAPDASKMAYFDIKSEIGEDGKLYAETPLMKGYGSVVVDDEGATVMMVFDYDEAADAENLKEMVANPLEEAQKLFIRSEAVDKARKLFKKDGQSIYKDFYNGPMTKLAYRNAVRKTLITFMADSGFVMSQFESCDKDQVFLKIALSAKGSALGQLAEKFKYPKAFNDKAYLSAPKWGDWFEGKKPPTNYDKIPVPAITNYKIGMKEKLEDFSNIDETRLIFMQIKSFVRMQELTGQGIIKRLFPVGKFQDVVELNGSWATMTKVFHLPKYGTEIERIRDYFGAKLAFFFMWTTFLVRSLSVLAFVGCFGIIGKLPGMPYEVHRYFRWVFCVVLILWSSSFNQFFSNHARRASQKWGMDGATTHAAVIQREDWDPFVEGSMCLTIKKWIARFGVVTYLIIFALLVGQINVMKKNAKEDGTTDYSPILIIVAIKGMGWIFCKFFAPGLASMQNPRTQDRWESLLSVNLTIVKLAIALYPFLDLAFFVTYTESTCAGSLAAAAQKVYVGNPLVPGWPEGTPQAEYGGTTLNWLDTDTFRYTKGDNTCIYGCFPDRCTDHRDGTFTCRTQCVAGLESSLLITFAVLSIGAIVNIIAPIAVVRLDIWMEMRKVEGAVKYTWLECLNKCSSQATHEYQSWGGSYSEDFVEYAILFGFLVCFSMISPFVAVVAFISSMIQYRLVAFRTVNVTCKPYPEVMDGIGVWQDIFSFITKIGLGINVALICLVLPPIRDYTLVNKCSAAIVLQHGLLVLNIFVGFCIPSEPQDVTIIRDINNSFSSSQTPKVLHDVHADKADYSGVSLDSAD